MFFKEESKMTDYEAESKIFRVLSEPTRLQILDILSCCEMCACNILDSLSISQSTLSHHMKALMECGLVSGRKDATWMYYSIRPERVAQLHQFLDVLTKPKEDCICNTLHADCKD
jgi:ArsR family transcriptional regulator